MVSVIGRSANALVLCGFFSFTLFSQPQYSVTDLGSLGGSTAVAHGINASGQVVGEADTAAGIRHAFRYDGSIHDLDAPAEPSVAYAINDLNQIVGSTGPTPAGPLGPASGFSWTSAGGIQLLLGLPGPYTVGQAVNDSGQIAGVSTTPNPYGRAIFWSSASSTPLDIGGSGPSSVAYGINASGEVVGWTNNWGGSIAFSWTSIGGLQDLGTLPGDSASRAAGINDAGQVVGASWPDGTNNLHAFLWTSSLGMQNLKTLGGTASMADAINASEQVVGSAQTASGATHAFLWQNGAMLDLNALISDPSWVLTEATAINHAGEIVGYGLHNGQTRAFLLNPIPPVPVIVIPGILGTKMSVANRSDCTGYPPACVAWLSNGQIQNGGFAVALNFPIDALEFSALQYYPNGNPTVPLTLNDIFNLVPDPISPDLDDNELDCNQFPISSYGGCSAWGRDLNVYNSLRDRLQQAGFPVTTFPYDWRRDLVALGDDLYLAVRQLAFPAGQSTRHVALVAHSMGGLLVSEMLNRHPDITPSIANVVTLGTPFDGATDAYLKIQGWRSLNDKFLSTVATQDIGRYWASPYFLLPQHNFVKDANDNLISNQKVYSGDFMPALFPALPSSATLPVDSFGAATGKTLAIIGSGYLTTTTIQVLNSVQNAGSTVPLMGSCRDYQADNGDGTVSVASAASSSSGITQELFVQEEHALLPSNAAVLDAITAFLNSGVPPVPTNLLRTTPFPPPIFWDPTICSPADLSAQGSTGRIVANGLIQVQGAHYTSSPDGTQVLLPASDQYHLHIQGTGVGTFTLVLVERDTNNAILQSTAFLNVPVSPSVTGNITLTPTGTGSLEVAVGSTTITITSGAPSTADDDLKLLSAIVVALQLPNGRTTSLLAKLDAASIALGQGNADAASGSLNAFANQVQAQANKDVPAATATGLISIANTILGLLSSHH